MSRKNHNSILFLTTLGVYLGLVLVGATPQVLAQAATTKQFSVKDEIEAKDDLDNPPAGELKDFFEIPLERAVSNFISDLKKIVSSGKFSSQLRRTFTVTCGHYYCSIENAGASISGDDNPEGPVADAFSRFHHRIDFGNAGGLERSLFVNGRSETDSCKDLSLELRFDQKALSIEFDFTRTSADNAQDYSEVLNRVISLRAISSSTRLSKLLYENTRALSKDSRVLVTTRLPRGSLDTLLASYAQ